MINLTRQETLFMLKVLSLTGDLRDSLETIISAENMTVSDCVADKLRDLCTERLDTHGFDENFSPTEEGKKLEVLIDRLYIG